MRRAFYLLYKTDKCEEFLQCRPFSLRSLLQFYKQIAPNNANTNTLYSGTVAVSQAQVSESEEHIVTIINYPSRRHLLTFMLY